APGHPPRAVKITGARNPLVLFNATDQSVALGIQESRAATWPLSRGLAAVNNDDAAGHKSGRVAGHINDERTQFFWSPNPPEWNPVREHAGELGVVKDPARSLGINVAGRQRVHRDVVRSPLQREGPRELNQRALARAVGGDVLLTDHAVHGRHVDHPSAAALD